MVEIHCARSMDPLGDRSRSETRISCVTLFASAQLHVEQEIKSLAERGAEEINGVEPRLTQNGLGVAHGLEPLGTVISAHATWPDAAERKIVLRVVQDRIVDKHTAGGRPLENAALRL